MRTLSLIVAVFFCAPVHAQMRKNSPCEDAAKLATAASMDAVLNSLKVRLSAHKRLTARDFDRVFDDSFFKGSDRPFEDLRTFEQRISSTMEAESRQIRSSYRRWASERLEEGPLRPSVEPGEKTITVALRSHQLARGSLNLDINRGRIKMSYQAPLKLQPPGSPPARARKFDKIIPIPEGADPDRYRIEPRPDGLLIIFDRARYAGTTEASE